MYVVALRNIEAGEEVDSLCYIRQARPAYDRLFPLDYDLVYRYDDSKVSTAETTSGDLQLCLHLQSLYTSS